MVLRGGGIIFTISMIVWAVLMAVQGQDISAYLPFLGVLVPLALLNGRPSPVAFEGVGFIDQSFLMVAVLGVLVFA